EWKGVTLSLSFPILLAVMILYPPFVAATVALIGNFDRREFQKGFSRLSALFNRSQIAVSVMVGSAVFHSLATQTSPWYSLVFSRHMFFRTIALEQASRELQDRERVLRALSNRMAEERQDERLQIAQLLHVDLGQTLFQLTLRLEMAKKRLSQRDLPGVDKDL